jgi:hypothetical protein
VALSPQVNLSGSDFDTLLAVYTGHAVTALTLVASNDNCTTGGFYSASCASFTISQGTVYRLQVDGAGGRKGSVAIAVTFVWATPANDAFSSPTVLKVLPATGTTLGASLQPGEPRTVAGKNISGSVWYQFTASSNGTAKVRRGVGCCHKGHHDALLCAASAELPSCAPPESFRT